MEDGEREGGEGGEGKDGEGKDGRHKHPRWMAFPGWEWEAVISLSLERFLHWNETLRDKS